MMIKSRVLLYTGHGFLHPECVQLEHGFDRMLNRESSYSFEVGGFMRAHAPWRFLAFALVGLLAGCSSNPAPTVGPVPSRQSNDAVVAVGPAPLPTPLPVQVSISPTATGKNLPILLSLSPLAAGWP